jgi:hypothetical protein
VDCKLPLEYAVQRDVFSKAALDRLPPHRLYDYKIQLEGENTMDFSPLYNLSLKELQAAKKYIIENL